MKRPRRWLAVAALLAALALAAPPALGQSGGGYTLDWFTVDSGGGPSSGGALTLNATVAQPDAGVLAGGNYTLTGGFWAGASSGPGHLYLPLVTH